MTKKEFEERKKRIDDYFDKLTPEQLEIDLKKADYEFYKTIKTKVIDVQETTK